MQTAKNERMLRTIALLAWPTILEQILQSAVSYVDSAMVGRLGAEATAAVGCTATINWLTGSCISALGVGFLAYIARSIGAGQGEKARHAVSQVFLAVLVSGFVFTLVPLVLAQYIPVWMNASDAIRPAASRYFFIIYTPMLLRAATILFGTCLRAAGDTRTPMRINVSVNLINVVLNYLFIYPSRPVTLFGLSFTMPGFGMGTDGAAIASAIAFAAGGIAITIAILRHPLLSPGRVSLRPDRAILSECLRITFPSLLQRLATGFGYVAFSSMINSLGTVSLAAHSIANTAESAFYIPGWGMQAAAATLSGNTYGMNDPARMKKLTRTLLLLELAVMAFSGALLFAFARPIMGLFTRDAQVISLGARVLCMVALSEPVYGISIILDGIFQGVGDTFRTFLYNVIGMWGIRILGTFLLLKLGMGSLEGAWACMIAHNAFLGLALGVRYLRGKWNPLARA